MKLRIYEIIEKAENGDTVSRYFDNTILLLILLTIVAIIMESYQEIDKVYAKQFSIFEIVSVTIFSIEYVMRVWTSDIKYKDMPPMKARIKYMFSFMALIDLFAILPFYLPMFLPFDLRFLRILRLTRLFRVFKLNRYSKAMNLIAKVMKDKKKKNWLQLYQL